MAGYLQVVGVALGLLVGWLAALTVALLRWRAQRGELVYRRLPNGRLRFEWSVNQAYQDATHSVVVPRPDRNGHRPPQQRRGPR